jgi:hypothetical protein
LRPTRSLKLISGSPEAVVGLSVGELEDPPTARTVRPAVAPCSGMSAGVVNVLRRFARSSRFTQSMRRSCAWRATAIASKRTPGPCARQCCSSPECSSRSGSRQPNPRQGRKPPGDEGTGRRRRDDLGQPSVDRCRPRLAGAQGSVGGGIAHGGSTRGPGHPDAARACPRGSAHGPALTRERLKGQPLGAPRTISGPWLPSFAQCARQDPQILLSACTPRSRR